MREVYADTSFFIALLNRRDQHHAEASRRFAQPTEALATTAWVLVELGNYLSGDRRRPQFVPFVKELVADPGTTIMPPDHDLYDAGLDLYHRRPDKEWSVTDCISFVVMERLGITDALTADHHFEQAGFRILLK